LRIYRLVLVEPEGKINMGFILRLCKNFSVEDICVVNPQFDIRDEEVIEFSAKASDFIEKVKVARSLQECLKGAKIVVCTTAKARKETDLLRQSMPPQVLHSLLPSTGVTALVFGRESVGLRRSELRECDIVSTLETGAEYNVLNLSHAVAIYLYELRRAEAPYTAGVYEECSDRSLKSLRRVLRELEALTGDVRGVQALKNVIFRSGPRKPECRALYKFLKKMRYRLMKEGPH